MAQDRELLLGVLAVQLGLVTPRELLDVAGAWATDPRQGLSARLRARGVLDEARARLLDGLVEEAVRQHAGDGRAALHSLGGEQAVVASFQGVARVGAEGELILERPAGEAPAEPRVEADAVTAEHAGRYVYGPEGRTDRAAAEAAELGRGGIGRVLVALDTHLGRQVALKELLGGAGSLTAGAAGSPRRASAELLVRFLREARVTGQLEHPGIVPVYELGRRPDGRLYYTMKLVRGQSLAERLRACRGLADRLRLLTHFKDLCQAMAYAHSRGVVHRDLKPHNVMLGEFGETVVLDWGLAKARGQEDVRGQELAPCRSATGDEKLFEFLGRPLSLGEDPCRTQDGATLGTPAYMSPEQADGRVDAIDERSDVWGLGAVLHELLTGRPPHEGSTVVEVLSKVLREPVRPVRERCPQAPAELAAICQKALSREPAGRYPDARALAGEIEAYLTGGRVSAYRYGLWDLLRRFAVRHRSAAATAGVALLLLLALGVVSYLGVVAERDRARVAEQAERLRAVELLVAGARDALGRGEGLRAGGMLRAALEAEDTLPARALWRRLGQERRLAVLQLPGQAFSLAFTPDGRELLALARAGQLLRIDPRSLTTSVLRSASPFDPALALSADGRRVAFAAGGDRVRVVGLPEGQELLSIRFGRVSAWGLAFSPDGQRLAMGFSHALRLVDAATGASLRELTLPGGVLVSLRFQPGGDRLATGQADGAIRLWQAERGELRAELRGHTDEVRELAFSPDGLRLASASVDRSVRLWDVSAGQPTHVLLGHTDRVYSVDWSPDGRWIASGGADGVVRLWDARSGAPALVLEGHTRRVISVRFSPDSRRLASCSYDHTLRLWDVSAPRLAPPAENPVERAEAVDFGAGGRLAVARADGLVELRDLADGVLRRTLRADPEDVFTVAFSPDGLRLATGGWSGVVRLWEVGTGKLLQELAGHRLWVQALAFSPDGRWLASGGGDGAVRLWEPGSGREAGSLAGHTRVVADLRFDSSGRWLASGGTDGALRLWDVAARRLARELPSDLDSYVAAVFLPGAEELLYIGPGRTLQRVRLADGRARVLLAPGARLDGLHLSQDGRRVALQADGQLLLLDVGTGAVLERRPDMQLSPDGRWGWGACLHNAPCVWDVAAGLPAWRGPLLLATPGEGPLLLSQAGWRRLPEGAPPTNPPRGAWVEAAARSELAALDEDGRVACLLRPADLGGQAVELWELAANRRLATRPFRRVHGLVPHAAGCAVLDEDGASLLLPSGEVQPLPAPGQESARLALADRLVLGYPDGSLEVRPRVAGTGARPRVLQTASASPVLRLVPGPAGSLVAGFVDGTLALWALDSGELLELDRLHGPVVHLRLEGDSLLAATSLGDAHAWDLAALVVERCALLREVWRDSPGVWRQGRLEAQPAPADHVCARGP